MMIKTYIKWSEGRKPPKLKIDGSEDLSEGFQLKDFDSLVDKILEQQKGKHNIMNSANAEDITPHI